MLGRGIAHAQVEWVPADRQGDILRVHVLTGQKRVVGAHVQAGPAMRNIQPHALLRALIAQEGAGDV